MSRTKAPPDTDGVRALAALTCIGLTTARMLSEAGVPDPKTLEHLGASSAYRRLRFHFGKRATASYLYALECAITATDWSALKRKRMAALKIEAREIANELDALARKPSG